jgi:PPOX class probable F420-dependent enzyme
VTVRLDDATRELLDGKNFATLATVGRDGAPHASVTWYRRDGDAILFSTTAGRRKARDIATDPRVTLTVFDLGNPYHSVEIRGTAELIDDPEKRLPHELSHRYLGVDPPDERADEVRLIIRVVPQKVVAFRV